MLRLSWLISMGISLFGVMIIEHFFTLNPDGESGAGNLGAVGLALVMPFLLLSVFTTFRLFLQTSRHAKDNMMRTILLVFGVALLAVVTYYAIEYKNDAEYVAVNTQAAADWFNYCMTEQYGIDCEVGGVGKWMFNGNEYVDIEKEIRRLEAICVGMSF